MIPAVTAEQHAPRSTAIQPAGAWQFRTSSLLWLTFTAAMTLAYARTFGEQAVLVVALTPLLALAIGAGIGSFTRRASLAMFWAVVGATAGAICVVAAPVNNNLTLVFWPLVGAIAGGFAGADHSPLTWRALLRSMAVGGVVAGLFYLLGGRQGEFYVDAAFAPLVSVALAILVRLVDWLQSIRHKSRDAWAAGMIFAVIAGNLWAAFIAGRL
jgi:hypothetical protein